MGMHGLQGSFPHFKDQLIYEEREATDYSWNGCIALQLLQASTVGLNQIQSTFMRYITRSANQFICNFGTLVFYVASFSLILLAIAIFVVLILFKKCRAMKQIQSLCYIFLGVNKSLCYIFLWVNFTILIIPVVPVICAHVQHHCVPCVLVD
jgi:hypothetical protein